jgi:NAD(P)-dependent dehydrogenase (short-subunit alcohol dehydrogenase family)
MRVVLTGGSGDLGHVLSREFEARGDVPVRFDVRPPLSKRGLYVQGSILDRDALQASLAGADCVVHIAAWHGIHEATGARSVYDFWDLNVTGTFYAFEAAVRAGVRRVVYISSTSVRNWSSVYGHTKVLGEEVARAYAQRHRMRVITLRPRAFIPPWNREVYRSFVEWARWFWRGAVHIDDVSQAVARAVELLGREALRRSTRFRGDMLPDGFPRPPVPQTSPSPRQPPTTRHYLAAGGPGRQTVSGAAVRRLAVPSEHLTPASRDARGAGDAGRLPAPVHRRGRHGR